MRALKLKMEGFGSYIKRTEIDFTAFDKNSLFLIMGNTGGGKTTILDAICFSLYGKATGGLRSWEQMRSIGADDSVDTMVDFTFALGEHTYRFFRRQQAYIGRRGGQKKIKTENSCYEIFGDEERLIQSGADRSISLEAQRLLGLDCEQFSRVMVLPQGEFRRLLLSPSTEKASLFEKLFNTELWTRITVKAQEKAQEIQNRALELEAERQSVLSAHSCENTQQLEEKAEECNKAFDEANKQADKLEKELKAYEKEYNALKKLEETAGLAENAEASLKAAISEQALAKEKYEAAAVRLKEIPDLQKESGSLKIMEERLKTAIKSQSDISKADSRLKECEESVKGLNENIEDLNAKAGDLEKRIKDGSEFLAQCRQAADSIPAEAVKLQKLTEIDKDYKNLERLGKEQKTAEAELLSAEENYNKLSLELEQLKCRESELDERLKGNMAVYISSSLAEGKPCPVCGSVTHPAPAVHKHSDDNEISKNLKDVRGIIKKIDADMSAAINRRSAAQANLNSLTQQLNAQAEICSAYNIYRKTFQRDIEKQSGRLKSLNDSAEKIKPAESRLEKLKIELDKVNIMLEKRRQERLELERSRAQLEEKISALKKYNAEYDDDESSLKIRLKECTDRIIKLENLAEKIHKEASNTSAELKAKNALLEERKKQLNFYTSQLLKLKEECKGFKSGSFAEAYSECVRLNEMLKLALSRSGEIKKESEDIKRHIYDIKKNQGEYDKTVKLYSVLKHISDILRGSNPMKTPMKMFVLGMMLEDILLQSNKYFSILSDGRYRLEKSSEGLGGNSLKGLDIEVFDGNYGDRRPVFTLSGGEMFLASLSLAFGLSDVVQSYSGGIRLDSIFIDEGFGSLDSETVETAMKALDKIKSLGRTVGIISHVAQLSEKIANKIIVTSGSNGSRARIVTA